MSSSEGVVCLRSRTQGSISRKGPFWNPTLIATVQVFLFPRQRYKPQTKENESTIETARNYRKEEKKTKGWTPAGRETRQERIQKELKGRAGSQTGLSHFWTLLTAIPFLSALWAPLVFTSHVGSLPCRMRPTFVNAILNKCSRNRAMTEPVSTCDIDVAIAKRVLTFLHIHMAWNQFTCYENAATCLQLQDSSKETYVCFGSLFRIIMAIFGSSLTKIVYSKAVRTPPLGVVRKAS